MDSVWYSNSPRSIQSKKKNMSIRAYSHALKLAIRPAARKSVLLVLADYSVDTGKSYPQIKTIIRDSGLSSAAIETHLAALCEDLIITDTGIRTGEKKDVRVFQLNTIQELKLQAAKSKASKILKKDDPEAIKVYEIYPRPIRRPKTLVSISRCIKKYGFEVVFHGTKVFADAWKQSCRTDIEHIPYSTTFFNGEQFNDDPASWGLLKQVKIVTGIPSNHEMQAYAREKDPDATFCAAAVAGFNAYWTKQKWQKNGNQLDWKNELANFLGRERARVANAKT